MLLYYCRALVLLLYHHVSNTFTVLPAFSLMHINMPTSCIASRSAILWLASGHPKLNCGRMLPRHPAAVLFASCRARRWR